MRNIFKKQPTTSVSENVRERREERMAREHGQELRMCALTGVMRPATDLELEVEEQQEIIRRVRLNHWR